MPTEEQTLHISVTGFHPASGAAKLVGAFYRFLSDQGYRNVTMRGIGVPGELHVLPAMDTHIDLLAIPDRGLVDSSAPVDQEKTIDEVVPGYLKRILHFKIDDNDPDPTGTIEQVRKHLNENPAITLGDLLTSGLLVEVTIGDDDVLTKPVAVYVE